MGFLTAVLAALGFRAGAPVVVTGPLHTERVRVNASFAHRAVTAGASSHRVRLNAR